MSTIILLICYLAGCLLVAMSFASANFDTLTKKILFTFLVVLSWAGFSLMVVYYLVYLIITSIVQLIKNEE